MNILIFDSGLGGLSVAREVVKLCPKANIFYLADHAYFPYGKLTEETLIARVVSLLANYIDQVDVIIIACNTASTIALTALRKEFNKTFIGTVPAIKPACEQTKSGLISVLATEGTIKRDYTQKLIADYAKGVDVTLVGSENLAEICEDILQGKEVKKGVILSEIYPCFVDKMGKKTDIIVLACTHYPLILPVLKTLIPWDVTFIDPAPAIAQRLKTLFPEFNQGESQRIAFTTGNHTPSLSKIFMNEGYLLRPLHNYTNGHLDHTHITLS